MQKVSIFLLLRAVFFIELTSPTRNYKVQSKDLLEYAEIEQTMMYDIFRGAIREVADYIQLSNFGPISMKLLSILNKFENYFKKLDPNGNTLNEIIIDIKDLLEIMQSAIPAQKK